MEYSKIVGQVNALFTGSSQLNGHCTAQRMKFSVKDFCSKYDQIHSFLRFRSHLLKKSLIENFIFCAVLEFALLKNLQHNTIKVTEMAQGESFLSCFIEKKICFKIIFNIRINQRILDQENVRICFEI